MTLATGWTTDTSPPTGEPPDRHARDAVETLRTAFMGLIGPAAIEAASDGAATLMDETA